ncbi:hypothetical protein Droror1_Dr00014835 [Drosera rotundifolia]
MVVCLDSVSCDNGDSVYDCFSGEFVLRYAVTILGTRLDSLESLLAKLPSRQPMSDKEMNRRRDMLSNLRSKTSQMASTLSMSNFGNRDTLIGPKIKPVDAMTRVAGVDNQGIVSLQRQVMRVASAAAGVCSSALL